ncbi:flagellar hook-basal body complex protein [Periweissella beninensis]|uniref:Flagellar hook protein FlgE n=1 Tax=Periweissella beninensis TaxID=504936 RepID=A0ABT0VGI5_9LACO|nr:flagellar hook-basal body complex protein [Periweissella beninensis]MBM7544700.1 flagellar hook protein FlgE [Periweissella beninensis]MCM2436938.1 flagellar hook-basal body complex protein [Periweissella beninensis]MCT4396325.1 flagellar hook-basal body complex protein [Periweissella beninensis]
MLRSLYSGVSGLKSLQVKMDTVANNIANANTMGFKSSRTMFEDLISQTTASPSAPSANLGGINAKQVGLGVQVGSTDLSTGIGAPQQTGRALDVYIAKQGYFKVTDGDKAYYTRDGDFQLDKDGTLVTKSGLKVAVTNATKIPAGAEIAIDAAGKISYVNDGGTITQAGQIETYNFSNPAGLTKAGGNLFSVSNNSGQATDSTGKSSLQSGALEMSNVDLSTEFTDMIIANRAYQANARTITTSDEMLQELVNLKH